MLTQTQVIEALIAMPPHELADTLHQVDQHIASLPVEPEMLAELKSRSAAATANPESVLSAEEWVRKTREKFGWQNR